MSKTEKHIHKFKRLRYRSGNEIFFCTLPDCSHKSNIALALGKRSLCWRCGNAFIMDEYSLRLAKPHCQECHKPKGFNAPEVIEEIIPYHNPTAETELFDKGQYVNENDKQQYLLHKEALEQPSIALADRLRATIQSAKQAVQEADEEI